MVRPLTYPANYWMYGWADNIPQYLLDVWFGPWYTLVTNGCMFWSLAHPDMYLIYC
jgi:hypothetical protein